MAKYSSEFKERIVKEYLSGKGTTCFLGEKYEVVHITKDKVVTLFYTPPLYRFRYSLGECPVIALNILPK